MIPGNGIHFWEEFSGLYNILSRTDNASRRGKTAQRQRKQGLAIIPSLVYLGCWLFIKCSVYQFLHLCSDNTFSLYFLIEKISVIDFNTTVYPKNSWWGNSGEKKKGLTTPSKEKSVKGDTNKQEMHLEDGKQMGGWSLGCLLLGTTEYRRKKSG